MGKKNHRKNREAAALIITGIFIMAFLGGCAGYSNESLFSEKVNSVYLKMFDNQSFRRGIEYELSDALGKRIEAESPYKLVSNRNVADTLLTGQIVSVNESAYSTERQTGRALEKNLRLEAVVNWKNLKTGEIILDNVRVSASSSYSEWQNQGFDYGSSLAANKLADRIVELMEKKW